MRGVRIEKIGPYELHHPGTFPAVTEDPYRLVDFLINSPGIEDARKAIDIGTATGVIPLLLAAKTDIETITGVEVDEETAKCALENIERNGLGGRVKVINKDYRDLPEIFEAGSFDIVVSNPPYIKAGHGRVSDDDKRATARYEKSGNLKELIKMSKLLLRNDGRLFLIFPSLRKAELLDELRAAGFSVVREEPVGDKEGAAKLFMVEAGRNIIK